MNEHKLDLTTPKAGMNQTGFHWNKSMFLVNRLYYLQIEEDAIMGRNATITIWNKTAGNFMYVKDHVEHGKFQTGHEPPKEIDMDMMLSFEVGNCTGAKIGPKGSVTYTTTQNGETFNIVFDWDHPFSASTSSYHCYSDPLGKISAVLSPNHPTGHNQSITWTVQLV